MKKYKKKHGKDKFSFNKTVYTGDNKKVIITCVKHGDFTPLPSNILQGSECPKCAIEQSSIRNRKSQKLFIEQASAVHNNKYNYSLVEYKNNSSKIKIVCPTHGVFEQQPNVHLDQKCGCPKCTSSRGEIEVRIWLDAHNIPYISQKTFDGCKFKNNLYYDFYLPSYNVLIEYNGIQHYREDIPLYKHSNDTFKIIQHRDKIKYNFAITNEMTLIVIPYTSKVSVYLDNHLSPLLIS